MEFEPEQLYEVDSDLPDLRGAVLLVQLDGFMDAGSAGKTLSEHLLSSLEGQVVARFDVDRLIDYRSRRPVMTFVTDHWADYEAPELNMHLLQDSVGTDFLLLTGLEPDHEWERFAAAVQQLVEKWELRLVVFYHGIPMGAPHTRPLGVTAHGSRTELVAGHSPLFNRIQVPASAAALLEYRLGQTGQDALGFAAHVPHYLANATYQTAALTLLNSVAQATQLSLPEDALREAARRTDAEINKQVEDSAEVAEVVRGLERQYDTFAEASGRQSLLIDDQGIPTAEELGNEFERFLAEQGNPDSRD
ncbi:MAG TPA: PAC2 family protein [Pseudonocardiaceae bacterium]|nr:PAC2 family protein [Pseudonocardiaceae bacterium]